MSRVCSICGKGANAGNSRSHALNITKRIYSFLRLNKIDVLINVEAMLGIYTMVPCKLLKIKNLLIGHTPPTELEELLTQCGYLYLHFPDGHLGANTDVNFLKRIRAEINYFLKITSL